MDYYFLVKISAPDISRKEKDAIINDLRYRSEEVTDIMAIDTNYIDVNEVSIEHKTIQDFKII
jgi:hypothetical protein